MELLIYNHGAKWIGTTTLNINFPPQRNIASTKTKARIILALKALQKDKKLSLRAAASIYNVSRTTLTIRRDGRTSRYDTPVNSRKLTDLEERTIVQYITKLCIRAFPPRLANMEDIANRLLCARDAPPVGKLWAHNFVKRQPVLRMRFTRRYDYQRAKYKDLKIIREWFTLIHNTKAKYSILNEDSYNFNETGFIMGIITTGIVVTTSNGFGKVKKAQPGNRK